MCLSYFVSGVIYVFVEAPFFACYDFLSGVPWVLVNFLKSSKKGEDGDFSGDKNNLKMLSNLFFRPAKAKTQ